MHKHPYHATPVHLVNVSALSESLHGERVAVGVDVAKHDMVAAFMDERRRVHVIVSWKQPQETSTMLALLEALTDAGARLEVPMEPTGTYGDPLRFALLAQGLPVFRVGTKRCRDAAELYDGVPSRHDPKCAAIIAKLHLDDLSEPWPLRTDEERELGAAIRTMEIYDDQVLRNTGRLEAQLARHWPELPGLLELRSATLLELLSTFGGPKDVTAAEAKACALMRRVGGHLLMDDKIDIVIAAARTSLGVPMLAEERLALMELAHDTRRADNAAKKARRKVERLSRGHESASHMGPVVGQATAAVLVSAAGDPRASASPAAYVKTLGLNLKVVSSGKSKGDHSISKRGSGTARRYLYLACLRLIQRDDLARAWYQERLRRNGALKKKGVVALMRKYARALWYVARGAVFDSALLFNTSRLPDAQTGALAS